MEERMFTYDSQEPKDLVPDFRNLISQKQRWALTADSPTPLYHRLYLMLKGYILDGTLPEGTQLPTELELAKEFEVSRITSKRALDELASENLVIRQRGKGTYVTHSFKPEPLHVPMVGLIQEIETLGKDTQATVLDCAMLSPPREIRDLLGLEPGETVLHLSRVRHRGGVNFGIYRSWTAGMSVPRDLSVFQNTPRMTYFRRQGLKFSYMRQTISAQAASEDAAEVLGVAPGFPLLSVVRCTYPDRGMSTSACDYLKVLYHPRRFAYQIDLDIGEAS